MDRVEAVTDLIDQVLDGNETQHSPEADAYGDVAPAIAEGCWRCGAPPAADSDSGLCPGCRAFLLEDSDVDPAAKLQPRTVLSDYDYWVVWGEDPAERDDLPINGILGSEAGFAPSEEVATAGTFIVSWPPSSGLLVPTDPA